MISGIYNPDPSEGTICLVYPCGLFDLIVLQGENKEVMDLGRKSAQPLFDKPLQVMHLSEVRTLEWDIEEVYLPLVSK